MLQVTQKHFEAVSSLAAIPINQKVKHCTDYKKTRPAGVRPPRRHCD